MKKTASPYTIIIPAYNESAVLGKVLDELDKPEGCAEIIVVDDGSTDNTAEIARRKKLKVVSHSQNRGYGAALKSGILNTRTEVAIIYDGDGQHRPEDLKKIVAVAHQYDMVIGARSKKSQKDWFRLPWKIILNFFCRIISGCKIPDINSGLRSYKTSVIKKYLHLMPDGFSMSTTSTIAFLKMGHTIKYIPITTRGREGRRSSVKLKDGLKSMMLILNLIVLFSPQRVFSPISFFFILFGIGYFIFHSLTVEPDITASMVLLILTGIIIFFMGIICEHVSAIRREIHK